MAIEVRIPTILRSYTGGAKAVEGSGATLDELLNNLDAAHGGLRERLVDGEKLRRFVNVYLNDEEAVVIYHSHTATQAYPSRTDISYASEPQAHYVLVSTRDETETEFRSYRILDGEVTEEPVVVTE